MKPEELKVGQKYRNMNGLNRVYIGPSPRGFYVFEDDNGRLVSFGEQIVNQYMEVKEPRSVWAVYLRDRFYMATDDIESAQIQADYYSGTIAEFKEVI